LILPPRWEGWEGPRITDTDGVSEDLVQAARAAKDLEPAIEAFAEATGALGPVRESTGWLGDVIRVRREVHLAKVLMKAAEKIKVSGLPPHAVRDKLLRAAVEDASMEEDESLQERWANLLAHAATDKGGETKIVYAKILSELEPGDVRFLDRIWGWLERNDHNPLLVYRFDDEEERVEFSLELDNLSRLGVLRQVRSMPVTFGGPVSEEEAKLDGVELTLLGLEFMRVCQEPAAPETT
jgi:hypothetical protein